ncbi:hypothetical protein ACWCQP_47775 [Streptomyces chartreusis]
MNKARLYLNGRIGAKVFAHEIDDEPWWRQQKVPLICAFCLTAVVSQRKSVGRHPRAALFRLGTDLLHEDTCPLNPVEILQKIARGSKGVTEVHNGELHLVLPDDLGQIAAAPPVVDTDIPAPGDRVGVDIATVRPLLPPLINSAVVIARFLQKHDYDPDVVAQFKVRRPGEKDAAAWGDFCYGPAPDDQARLYGRATGGQKPAHPVAVYGRITGVHRDLQERPVAHLADGDGFTVRIRSEHPSLLDPLTAGVFVLAVGNWKVWTPRKGNPELQMFAEEHWQLAHWTYDDASGDSTAPRCPPPLSLAQHTLARTRAAANRPPAPGSRSAHPPTPRPRPTKSPEPAAPPPASPPVPPTSAAPPPAADATSPPPPAPPSPANTPPPPDPAPAPPPPPAYPPAPSQAPKPRRHRSRAWWRLHRRR